MSRAEQAAPGASYVMAIDPATMTDRYAFVICHKDGGRVVLDYAHILKPPVDPNQAEDLLRDLVRRFKPQRILCDTSSTTQRLKAEINALEYTPFTRPLKLKIYGALKEALNLDRLVLYRDTDLLDELKALQIRGGVDISAPKSGRIKHDDLSDCLALCCEALIGHESNMAVIYSSNPFAGGDDDDERFDRGWQWQIVNGRGFKVGRETVGAHELTAEAVQACADIARAAAPRA